MPTIPASQIVQVNPNVLAAAGQALNLNGLILTTSVRAPIGSVLSFPTAGAVATYFGANSQEAALAATYFAGYTGATATPGALLFAQYPASAVGAYLRGGNISGISLASLQALNGSLSVTIDGVAKSSGTVNLAAAASFSAAAGIISSALGLAGGTTCTFDSVSGGFLFNSGTTGSASTIGFASGTLSAPLLLTAATGAVTSQGAGAATPGVFMNALIALTQNWALFTTAFNPDAVIGVNPNKLAFALWAAQQNNRYGYVGWDSDPAAAAGLAPNSFGGQVEALEDSGTCPVWDPTGGANLSAFVLGAAAAINFNQTNGRITFDFKAQPGLVPGVTDPATAANLIANSYNFFGAYATANQTFNFFNPGSVAGQFEWLDSFCNQIWMNAAFQSALLTLLTNVGSIPYNQAGYSLIQAALAGPINAAGNFGVYRPGVVLSASQIAQVNSQAGVNIAGTLATRGWYLQILDPGPTVRQARGTPVCNFWYVDGQSVQLITLASIELI